jgi:hypothetical protein
VRWRQAAAAAAGLLAAVGLNAHKAAADDAETSQPTTTTSTPEPEHQPDVISDQQRAQLEKAQHAAATTPAGDGPVHTKPALVPAAEPAPEPPSPVAESFEVTDVRRPAAVIRELASPRRRVRGQAETSSVGEMPEPVAEPLTAAPVDDPAGKSSPTAPAQSNNATVTTTPVAPKATPPPSLETPTPTGDWVPAAVNTEIDQRIAERWRTSPVRGPPPSSATALGNDSRNTTTQVVVVRDQFGHSSVAVSSQTATVHNVGVATAEGYGGGDATATGNTSDTSILQVAVIQQRGTGSATVEQSASVDNYGTASATTAGAANAVAVGNDSSTSVTQIAVVYVEGAGNGHVSQSTAVDNEGLATAEATDRDATAVGNTSDTEITQIAVVHVGNDDTNVSQTQTTENIGVATATGGTASGNTATNTSVQVAHTHR